eukprot:c21020_g2_i1 orf=1-204(-)
MMVPPSFKLIIGLNISLQKSLSFIIVETCIQFYGVLHSIRLNPQFSHYKIIKYSQKLVLTLQVTCFSQ